MSLLRAICRHDCIIGCRQLSSTSTLLAAKVKKQPTVSKKQQAAKARKKALKQGSKDSHVTEKMTLLDAIHILRSVEVARPKSTYELTVKTAMPRGAPIPRGRVSLPLEPKAKPKDTVLVFAEGALAAEAKQAGADIVGGPEIIEPVATGKLSATIILCTPSLIRAITPRLGRILGPRGMMPSDRRGTVTEDIVGFLKRLHGSSEWKGDKAGTIRTAIGKIDFRVPDVVRNVQHFIDSVKIATNTAGRDVSNAEPDPNKPQNPITKVILSSTQGPGIPLSDVV